MSDTIFEEYWRRTGITYPVPVMKAALKEIAEKAFIAGRGDYKRLERECVELKQKLDRYTRMSEAGESLGDHLDLVEEHMALERECAELRKKLEQAEKVEKEECAKVCERQLTDGDYRHLIAHGHWDHVAQASQNCAKEIRARSNKDEQKEPPL